MQAKPFHVHNFKCIWGYVPFRYLDTRIVDVHISRLRAKNENDVQINQI